MININDPGSIISGLLENLNNIEILPDLIFHNIYTGNFYDLAYNSGVFGVLPLAGTSTGDILALTPLLDKNVTEWPVLKFSHRGGDTAFVSTSLSTLPVFAMLGEIRPKFILDDKEIIIKSREHILTLNNLLNAGHLAERFIEFLENLPGKAEQVFDEYTLSRMAVAPCWFMDFLDTYKRIYMEDMDPVQSWNEFLKQYPFIVPAWQLLFGAESKMGKDAFTAAWKSVSSEYYYNNYIFNLAEATSMSISGIDVTDSSNITYLFKENPRVEAARYIINSGKGKEHPAYPAVEREAREEPDYASWLQAGNALLEKAAFQDAYCAYLNAGYWFYLENEDFCREAASGALKAAQALKNPILESLLEAVLKD